MLPTFIFSLSWIPAVVGLGSWGVTDLDDDLRAPVAGFLGLAVLAAAGMALNLAVPIGKWAASVAFVAGWVLFLSARRTLLRGTRLSTWKVLALVLAGCAALTQLPGRHFDAGLYHLQAVAWIRENAQPLGLANLHHRLGFNSSWHFVVALLGYPGLESGSPFVAGVLPVVFAAWAGLAGLHRLLEGRRQFPEALTATALVPASFAVQRLGSSDQDIALLLVGFVAMCACATALNVARGRRAAYALAAWWLSVFAVTIKLPGVVLVVASGLVLVSTGRELSRRQVAGAVIGPLVLWVPWSAHGILGSGCAVFPVAITCLPRLPWAVPRGSVAEISEGIRAWARAPRNAPAGFFAPLGRVIPYFADGWRFPFLALVALVLGVGLYLARRELAGARRDFWAVMCTSIVGLAFWAFAAPDPRFGFLYLLGFALAPLALALGSVDQFLPARRALLTSCALFGALGAYTLRDLNWRDAAITGWPRIPKAVVEWRTNDGGVGAYVPVGDARCWDTPLPCTPEWNEALVWDGMFKIVR